MIRRLRLSGWAASEVEIRAEDPDLGDLDDPNVRAVLDAWDGSAVAFEVERAEVIARGLCALSNACDEAIADLRGRDRFEAEVARHASAGLGTAASRARRAS